MTSLEVCPECRQRFKHVAYARCWQCYVELVRHEAYMQGFDEGYRLGHFCGSGGAGYKREPGLTHILDGITSKERA